MYPAITYPEEEESYPTSFGAGLDASLDDSVEELVSSRGSASAQRDPHFNYAQLVKERKVFSELDPAMFLGMLQDLGYVPNRLRSKTEFIRGGREEIPKLILLTLCPWLHTINIGVPIQEDPGGLYNVSAYGPFAMLAELIRSLFSTHGRHATWPAFRMVLEVDANMIFPGRDPLRLHHSPNWFEMMSLLLLPKIQTRKIGECGNSLLPDYVPCSYRRPIKMTNPVTNSPLKHLVFKQECIGDANLWNYLLQGIEGLHTVVGCTWTLAKDDWIGGLAQHHAATLQYMDLDMPMRQRHMIGPLDMDRFKIEATGAGLGRLKCFERLTHVRFSIRDFLDGEATSGEITNPQPRAGMLQILPDIIRTIDVVGQVWTVHAAQYVALIKSLEDLVKTKGEGGFRDLSRLCLGHVFVDLSVALAKSDGHLLAVSSDETVATHGELDNVECSELKQLRELCQSHGVDFLLE